MIENWTEFGLPDYAQFDNSTVFQGARHPDSLGRAIRCCLSLESLRSLFRREKPASRHRLKVTTDDGSEVFGDDFVLRTFDPYKNNRSWHVGAVREKNRERFEAPPCRLLIDENWQLNYSIAPKGKVIFIRRTGDNEGVDVMGHRRIVKGSCTHKLLRADVDLTKKRISFYRLRRREPMFHEFLGAAKYHFPNKPFKEN